MGVLTESRPAAGVPAPADPGRAVRRDAGAGAGRLAPRRRPRAGRGAAPRPTGWPASCCGPPASPAAARADGRVDARLAGPDRGLAGRPGARGRGRAPRPGRRRLTGRHDPAQLAGQPARRRPLPHSATLAEAEQVASRALEYAAEPDVVEDLHWTLAQCRMLAGSAAESLAALDQALAAPGISARHRARLLVLAARTHLHLGEVEEAGQVAASALEAATEAADNWAMAWALHVLTIMTGVQGHVADTLPLFDRALTVTQADPGLTDLRLLLQINQAVTLGNLDRYDEALAAAGQARQLAGQVGTAMRRTQAHSALGQLLFETGRWDDALAEVDGPGRGPQGARRRLLRPRHRRGDLLPPRRDRRGPEPPRRRRPARRADRPPAHRPAGPGPQPGPRAPGRAARGPGRADRRVRRQHGGTRGDRGPAGRRRPPRRPAPATWTPRRPSPATPPPSPPDRRSRTGRRTRSTAAPCSTTTPPGC